MQNLICSYLTNITTASLSPTNKLEISDINFSPRQLTFSWSPVAPDCPAIHYNILASNCGSCPTTTNHTNVTCTDVPTNGTCIFAAQTVVCGNIAGDTSYPIRINTGLLPPTESTGTYNLDTTDVCKPDADTVHITSINSLAAGLTLSVVVSITLVLTIIWSKAKIKAALNRHQKNRSERITHLEPNHEDVTGPLPSLSVTITQDNVAYGHMWTDSTTHMEALYEDVSDPLPFSQHH